MLRGFLLALVTTVSAFRPGFVRRMSMAGAAAEAEPPPAHPNNHDVVKRVEVPRHYKDVLLYSVSDIHVDYKQNLEWWSRWCQKLRVDHADAFLVLVVAGDIASSTSAFRTALERAKENVDEVFVVAGNHDLWIASSMMHDGVFNSIDKLKWIESTAEELCVHTKPACLLCPSGRRVHIVPLVSWYHSSFDKEPDLPGDVTNELYNGRAGFVDRWADFRFCKWPEEVVAKEDFVSVTSESTALADHMAAMNEEMLTEHTLQPRNRDATNDVVISFSHFLPRQELCPEKRFLIEPSLPKVIGSLPLGRQVSRLKPDLHIFGHTHIPIDITLEDGVRYLQWPLGSVSEQSRQCCDIALEGPLLLYDDRNGGLLGTISTRWGDHYSEVSRDPNNSALAPWVVSYWERLRKGGKAFMAAGASAASHA